MTLKISNAARIKCPWCLKVRDNKGRFAEMWENCFYLNASQPCQIHRIAFCSKKHKLAYEINGGPA